MAFSSQTSLFRRFQAPLQSLRVKVVLTFLVPALLTLGLFIAYARWRLQGSLDEELGRHLSSVAQAATTLLPPLLLAGFLPGDQDSRTWRNLQQRLLRLKRSTHLRRIYVFDRKRRSLLDTEAVAVGKEYVELSFESAEIREVWQGKTQASLLFQDSQARHYKTGFAPIVHEGSVIAAVAVEGSALYFATLRQTGRSLTLFSLVALGFVILAAWLFAALILKPVRHLVSAARAIGEGDLAQPVPSLRPDEIGFLAATMEEMRQNILARDRQMQMMLSGIAHEVRNPLGGMELFTGILEEELEGDPDKQSHVRRIQRELRYLADVVSSFLEYARPSQLEIKPCLWRDFAMEITMLLSADLEAKQIRIVFEGDAQDELIPFDRKKMHQVLLNLLQNAIHASSAGQTIDLRASRHQGGFLIEIADRGKGIAEADQAKIFEPFYTTKEKGTGLGLPLAQKLIRAHGGEIHLTSRLGEGSTFALQLPAKPMPPSAPPPPLDPSKPPSGDDDFMIFS